MAFSRVCGVDEVGPNGSMVSFYVMEAGVEVLITRDVNGELHAFEGTCPHEDYPLVEGSFDGTTITCTAHNWMISGITGQGVNPANCKIASFPLKVEGDDIEVDLD